MGVNRYRTRDELAREPDYMGWGGIIAPRASKRRPPQTPRPDEPARSRAMWSDEEDRRLIEMLKAGVPVQQIADVLQRTKNAVDTRSNLAHIRVEWRI